MLPMQGSVMSPQMWVFTDQLITIDLHGRAQGFSTSRVSDYWNKLPLVKILDFVKYAFLICGFGKICFFKVFCDSRFFTFYTF